MNAIREAIVAEAYTWLRTPFHHAARIKGKKGGVDCANLLIGVYSNVGCADAFDPEYYPPDWHLHNDQPRFVQTLLEYCDPVPIGETPLPGDIAMFRYGKHAAHGAIVVAWPLVIHAWRDVNMVVATEADNGPLGQRFAGCYRLKGLV